MKERSSGNMKTESADTQSSPCALSELSPTEQQELTNILDRYLQRIENGEAPNPEELLASYPQWSAILRRYLESLGVLHLAARGMDDSASQPQLAVAPNFAENRLLGDYEIRRQIGRGGMGIVYEARQVSLDRRVALKVLPLAAVLDSRQIARFRREAQAAAQLHHPHVVPVYGVGCENGIHFYSMQLVEGQSIDRVLGSIADNSANSITSLATIGRELESTENLRASETDRELAPATESIDLSEAIDSAPENSHASISQDGSIGDKRYINRVAELGIQAASGLQHAHDYGVVHRDIKPSNLMLDREGRLWITDFGLAHIQSEADNMTATGDLIGTLRYMSPEQAAGSVLIDQRTDIYSLGVTLYEMLTLRRAIPTKERAQLLQDIEHLEPKRIRKINPAVPKDLETIILKATSKDRDQRYVNAQEFADDLQRFLDGKPTMARRPTIIDLGTKWALRHRTIVGSCILVLMAALIGTSYSAFLLNQEAMKTKEEQNKTELERKEVLAQKQLLQEREKQSIETLERIAQLSKGLSKQPEIRREIQKITRDHYELFVERDMPFVEFAQTQNRMGELSMDLGHFNLAVESYRKSAKAFRQLASSDKSHLCNEALCLNDLGQALTRVGDVDEANQCYDSALSILAKLDQQDSDVVRATALAFGNLGFLAVKLGDRDSATTNLNRSIEIRRKLFEEQPNDIDNCIRLASNYHNLSELYIRSDLAKAAELCRDSIKLRKLVVEHDANAIEPRVELALSYNNLGSIALRQDRFEDATNHYELAVFEGERLASEMPQLPQLNHDLAISLNNLGKSQAARGNLSAAIEAYEKASKQFESLLPQFNQDAVTLARYGGTLYNQAVAHTKLRNPDLKTATQLFHRAVKIQKQSVQLEPSVTQYSTLLELSLKRYRILVVKHGADPNRLKLIDHELASIQSQEATHAN